MIVFSLLPLKSYSKTVNTSKRDANKIDFYKEIDVCTTPERMRDYKSSHARYPEAIEALMDCRGDVMALKDPESDWRIEEKVMWFALGVIATVLIEKNAGK